VCTDVRDVIGSQDVFSIFVVAPIRVSEIIQKIGQSRSSLLFFAALAKMLNKHILRYNEFNKLPCTDKPGFTFKMGIMVILLLLIVHG
jgi:hypothetical protein